VTVPRKSVVSFGLVTKNVFTFVTFFWFPKTSQLLLSIIFFIFFQKKKIKKNRAVSLFSNLRGKSNFDFVLFVVTYNFIEFIIKA